MKNLILALLATAITTTASLNTNAQNSLAKLSLKNSTVQMRVFDEPTSYINTAYKNTSALSKASSKALKDFAKSFKSPANTTWYNDGEGGFMAYFKDSTTSTHVDYNRKGNWVYTISIYSEKELPKYITYDVKVAYPLATINGVQEINIHSLSAYLIHIEDKISYKTLRYTSEAGLEEIEELHKYP